MYPLFETIRVFNGVPQHPKWHFQRMKAAWRELWPSEKPVFNGSFPPVPVEFKTGVVRCNMRYGPGGFQADFSPYEKRAIRSLKLAACDTIDYHLKYTDRSGIESLFALRGECDDILVVKKGLLTDTSVSNIIFYDGTAWITPKHPLLRGTCRQRLLESGRIREGEISPFDLRGFEGCRIISAMRPPEEMIIPVSRIIP